MENCVTFFFLSIHRAVHNERVFTRWYSYIYIVL